MAQSVKCPTSAQGMVSRFVGSSPALGSVLSIYLYLYLYTERERERDSTSGGGAEREGDVESQAGFRL